MTEKQPYDLVRTTDSYELRAYPTHVVAEVTVDGPFDDAGSRAFRFLFAYITGANRTSTKLSMTSPVVQEESTEIPMTAPVVQQSSDAVGRFTIAFVLPAEITVETAPDPTDAAVTIRGVPASTAAALSFGGRSTEKRFAQQLDHLRAALNDAGITTRGAPRFARFDAPIIPPLFRHNEVVIDVEAPA